LVHISELAPKRVAKVTDVVKEGDQVKVKLIGIDDRGKVRLSMKASTRRPARRSRPRAPPRRAARAKTDEAPGKRPPSGGLCLSAVADNLGSSFRCSAMQRLLVIPRVVGMLFLAHALMLIGADEISTIESWRYPHDSIVGADTDLIRADPILS